jgi:hypothetical protein
MAVAALVLAILSIPLAVIPLMFWLGLLLGLLAVVLALFGRASRKRRALPTGVATAALVLGLLGTAASAGMWAKCYYDTNSRDYTKSLPGLDDKKLNEEFNKAFEKALEESQKNQKK